MRGEAPSIQCTTELPSWVGVAPKPMRLRIDLKLGVEGPWPNNTIRMRLLKTEQQQPMRPSGRVLCGELV